MDIAEKIYLEASRLPEHLAREVLDFIGYIEKKYEFQDKEIHNLEESQIPVMNHIWDNEEDGVWDEC
jgi:hypothetical protein